MSKSDTKENPTLSSCLECKKPVFEFEDNTWGCDSCKSIWTFRRGVWVNIKKTYFLLKKKQER